MFRIAMLLGTLPLVLAAQLENSRFGGAGRSFGSALGRHAAGSVDRAFEKSRSLAGPRRAQEGAATSARGDNARQADGQPAAPVIYLPPPSWEEANPGWDYPIFGKIVKKGEAPSPSADRMRGISEGSKRQDVVAQLGTPSARIQMPGESGGLVEVYLYHANEEAVGAVRLQNGAVRGVVLNQ